MYKKKVFLEIQNSLAPSEKNTDMLIQLWLPQGQNPHWKTGRLCGNICM